MNPVRVMIVDDSSFSRTILTGILEESSFEVVGEADSIQTLIKNYDESKPDLVTMDIAMPGADGFECSRALLAHDPDARIILVSLMKDEESETEARRIGIKGYAQKPVDSETLFRIIQNVLSADSLHQNINLLGTEFFKEALGHSITRMTKTTATFTNAKDWVEKNTSRGITVIIGIIGHFPGTMIMDLSVETAEKMAEVILRRKTHGREETVAMAAEFANVVGGTATSMLNKKDKTFALRVAPPSVFFGASTEIVIPNIQLVGVDAETSFGKIYVGVGFKKGAVLWT